MADPTEKTEVIAGDLRAQQARIGRYRLERRLGAGGMAEVFLARSESDAGPHGKFEKLVVIKRIRPQLVQQPRFVEMFLREGRLLASLDHPNIVRIIELDEDKGEYFLALEYLEGLSLREVAERHWALGKPLPIEAVLTIVAEAALGLDYAHNWRDASGSSANIIHRDVSPDNLFVTTSGTTKVIDFGIAKRAGMEQLTQHGELKGKVPFMAPEHLQGIPLDARADLFSMGVVLYWLFTGRRPFDGTTDVHTMKSILEDPPRPPRQLNPRLPQHLEDIVLSLLEKDRNKRMKSAALLHDALMSLVVGMPRGAPQPANLVELALTVPSSEHEIIPLGPAAAPFVAWPAEGRSAAATLDDSDDVVDKRAPRVGALPIDTRQIVRTSDTADASLEEKTVTTSALNPIDTSTDEHKRSPSQPEPSAEGGVPSDPVIEVSRIARIDAQPTMVRMSPVSEPPESDVITTAPRKPRVDDQEGERATLGDDGASLPSARSLDGLFQPLDAPAPPPSPLSSPSLPSLSASSLMAPDPFEPPSLSLTDAPLATAELAPVAVTGTSSPSRAFPIAAGIVGALVVATIGARLGGLGPFKPKAGDDPAAVPVAPVVALTVVDAGVVAAPVVTADAGVDEVVAAGGEEPNEMPVGDADAGPGGAAMPARTTHRVALVAPSTVQWIGPNGESFGMGNRIVHLGEAPRTITAVDTRRGGRTKVLVDAKTGRVEYAKLAHQTLEVHARPFAEVFLGKERLGITPLEPIDVVAGSYELRFVYKKVTRVEHIDVKPNRPAAVNVVMAKTSP